MPMNGEYIIDSNIVIDIFRGKQQTIQYVASLHKIYVPVIVLGELYYGAYKSNQTPLRIQEIKQVEQAVEVLQVSPTTAKIYGEIKNQLKLDGTPIPENDIWIAALAKEHNLPLLTRDQHFQYVTNLTIESPT